MDSTGAEVLSKVVGEGLKSCFLNAQQKVHDLVTPLSQEQLWRRPFPYGNSVGHLLLHLTGNLRYYIGAQIASTGYRRDRPKEFSDESGASLGDVLLEFDDAIATVIATLDSQGASDLCLPYEGLGAVNVKDRFTMFVRCATHAEHHVGQILYLCKELALEQGSA